MIKEPNYFDDKSVEEIIDYLSKEKLTVNDLKSNLNLTNRKSRSDEEFINKLKTVEQRVNLSLEMSLRLFYFFFPFGLVNFLSKEDENLKRFYKYRYKRKIRDYFVFSILGSLFFIIVGLLLGWYSQNK